MESNHQNTMDVIVLDNPWLEVGGDTSRTGAPQSMLSDLLCPWGVWLGAALVTGLIHLLLLGSLLVGTGIRRPHPPLSGDLSLSALEGGAGESPSTYVVINDHSITPRDELEDLVGTFRPPLDDLADTALLKLAVDIPQIPSFMGADDGTSESPTEDGNGNGAEVAMLFGRYMGQVKARIERAWRYPTESKTKNFSCKIQIRQSRHGDVQEITLQRCDADPAWQVSLVQAIQAASPLSAPPSEKVFAEVIPVAFTADRGRGGLEVAHGSE